VKEHFINSFPPRARETERKNIPIKITFKQKTTFQHKDSVDNIRPNLFPADEWNQNVSKKMFQRK